MAPANVGFRFAPRKGAFMGGVGGKGALMKGMKGAKVNSAITPAYRTKNLAMSPSLSL